MELIRKLLTEDEVIMPLENVVINTVGACDTPSGTIVDGTLYLELQDACTALTAAANNQQAIALLSNQIDSLLPSPTWLPDAEEIPAGDCVDYDVQIEAQKGAAGIPVQLLEGDTLEFTDISGAIMMLDLTVLEFVNHEGRFWFCPDGSGYDLITGCSEGGHEQYRSTTLLPSAPLGALLFSLNGAYYQVHEGGVFTVQAADNEQTGFFTYNFTPDTPVGYLGGTFNLHVQVCRAASSEGEVVYDLKASNGGWSPGGGMLWVDGEGWKMNPTGGSNIRAFILDNHPAPTLPDGALPQWLEITLENVDTSLWQPNVRLSMIAADSGNANGSYAWCLSMSYTTNQAVFHCDMSVLWGDGRARTSTHFYNFLFDMWFNNANPPAGLLNLRLVEIKVHYTLE